MAWLFRPHPINIPPLLWVVIFGALTILYFTKTIQAPPTREIERIVIATPTAGALSPDTDAQVTPTPVGSGGTLAFAMRHNGNSDIYLISQNTGNLLRLTFDPDEDRDPAWSPDGKTLAFASRRARNWDLYLMDMTSGTVLRLTRTESFEANPAWSPDGKWLTYEGYQDGNLDIYILNVETGDSIRLTTDQAPDYGPAWSPDGRHIAYTSYRNGNKDIFLTALDDNSSTNLTNTPDQDEDYAAWSPDNVHLAYSVGIPGDETIWMIPFDKEALIIGELHPLLFGVGGQPTWSPDGKAMSFIFQRQQTSYLVAASTIGWGLAQQGYSTSDWMGTPDWTTTPLDNTLEERIKAQMNEEEPPLYTELLLSNGGTNYRMVNLPDVNGGNSRENLSDRVNDSYNSMRQSITEKTGWDYLSILGDSSRSMNHTPRPGQGRISWHVCGRAVDINQGYLSDDRIELIREDIGGVTYWRVFIKAQKQDGSLGEPLRAAPWDLAARSEGELATVQGGKLKEVIPSGYYIDFTTIAADYGWERRNALSNWRNSYFDIEWWHFQKTEGMSWYECMLEIYSEEDVVESYGILPWWTKRPEWEVQSLPW